MGLQEKRALKAFQENAYGKFVKEINDAAGYDLEFEVDWEALAEPGYGDSYEESFDLLYFKPVVIAFKNITVDELGKEGLKELVKKIVITNTKTVVYGMYAYKCEEGVLRIDHKFTNVDHYGERADELEKLLISLM